MHWLESPTSGNARPSSAVSRKTSGGRCCVSCVVGLVSCAPRAGRGFPSFLPIAPYIEFLLAARALSAGARARRGHTGMRMRTKSAAGCVHGCGEVRGRLFILAFDGRSGFHTESADLYALLAVVISRQPAVLVKW